MTTYGMLIDLTKCVGCYSCEVGCAERWRFPPSEVHKLSSTKNTVVQETNGVFVSKMCMHCNEPTCASVCPVGAFEKTSIGPVVYHQDKCMGCRYCMQACPFDIPKYQWESNNPEVTKCDLCHDRVTRGEQPACVESCPVEARVIGPLDELVQEANRRIAEDPSSYQNHIYGVKEAGGTSVLFLAGVDFESLGMKTRLPDHPLPTLTWEVLSKIPNYVFWGSTFLGGVWWITNRRKEVQEYEHSLKKLDSRNKNGGKDENNTNQRRLK